MREREFFESYRDRGCGRSGGRGPEAGFIGEVHVGWGRSFEMRGGRHEGFGGGRGRRHEHGFGGGRERMFEAGDLKLLIVHLISQQPSYGYQLIKTMEEKLSGAYAPSPGVIYPTLTMLEEEGLAAAEVSESNKKVYSVTPEGIGFLQANKRRLEELLERLEEVGKEFERGRSPQIMRAFMHLRGAVKAKVSREGVDLEQIKKIAEAIDAAARAIDDL